MIRKKHVLAESANNVKASVIDAVRSGVRKGCGRLHWVTVGSVWTLLALLYWPRIVFGLVAAIEARR
jgi:hypothetical protein